MCQNAKIRLSIPHNHFPHFHQFVSPWPKMKFAPISHVFWHFDNPNLLKATQTSNQCAQTVFPDELWRVVSQCGRRPFLAESLAPGQTWDQARSPTGFNAKVQPKEAAPTSEAHPNLLPRIQGKLCFWPVMQEDKCFLSRKFHFRNLMKELEFIEFDDRFAWPLAPL